MACMVCGNHFEEHSASSGREPGRSKWESSRYPGYGRRTGVAGLGRATGYCGTFRGIGQFLFENWEHSVNSHCLSILEWIKTTSLTQFCNAPLSTSYIDPHPTASPGNLTGKQVPRLVGWRFDYRNDTDDLPIRRSNDGEHR